MKHILFTFFVSMISTSLFAFECQNLTPTSSTYSEADDLSASVQSEYGTSYTVADWTDIKAIEDINSWITCMNLTDNQSFNILRNGNQIYYGTRQYFMRYCSDGDPGSNFLIHDQIGSYIFLGSWTGSRPVLAKKITTTIIEGNLIAYYPFNGNANDESGNGYNATASGAVLTTDRFNEANAAFEFDGDRDYIQANTSLPINGFPMSFCGWIYSNSFPDIYPNCIYSSDDWDHHWGSYKGFCISLQNNGKINGSFASGPNTSVNWFSTVNDSIQFNKWYHLAVVFESPSSVRIYINGDEKEVIQTHEGSNTVSFSNTKDRIGYGYDGLNRHSFNGKIDDVYIFSKALSASEVESNYLTGGGTDNSDVTVEISPLSDIKTRAEIYKNSVNYFYCNINQNTQLEYLENIRIIPMSSSEGDIPTKIQYLGNGILQFGVDFRSYPLLSSFTFELPEEAKDVSGATIKFLSQPDAIFLNLIEPEVEQSIDLFAGGSVGAKLTAGSAGAGPSISAAAISVEGSAGMGMTFTRKQNGDQLISRRLELGVGMKAEAPELNTVVGDVDVVSVSKEISGTMEQKMIFPAGQEDDLMLKAKAYTILETFSMGGIEFSPMTSLFIQALKKSLMNFNPDLQEVYKDLYYSTKFGVASTVGASAGLSFDLLGENCKFTLGKTGISTTMAMGLDINHLSNKRDFDLSLASEYNVDLLNFESLKPLGLGSLLGFETGALMGVNASFIKSEGFQDFGLRFETTSEGEILLANFSEWNSLSFNIPKTVIQRNLNANNLIGFVSPFCYSEYSVPSISLTSNKIVEYLDYYINDTPYELDDLDNFVSLSYHQASRYGIAQKLKLDLTAALGVGAGIKLGIEYSYMDELKYPLSEYTIIKNKLLPSNEFNALEHDDRFFSFSDEIYDLFEGTALLIEEPLKALEEKIENAIEAGQEFAFEVFDKTAKIAGTINNTGKFVIRKISSAIKRTKKSAFIGPQVIHAYTSNRVIILDGSKKASGQEERSTLYIISDHFNVSLLDNSDNVIMEFDPVNISIATEPSLIQELNFNENDLSYAKMYFYDDENLTWIELEGDLNPALDTVETMISKSGTYAVGINYNGSMDQSPVEILQYFPSNLQTIHPNDTLWVNLFEAPTGSGIDFTKTSIFIDGVEVESEWSPMTNTLRYAPSEPMSEGEHSFAANVYDNNGNYSNVFSVFKVEATNIDYSLAMENTFEFRCFPNPAEEQTTISIFYPGEKENVEIALYNSSGELIKIFYSGDIIHGSNEFKLHRNSLAEEVLQSGIYFVRLRRNNSMIVKKLIFK